MHTRTATLLLEKKERDKGRILVFHAALPPIDCSFQNFFATEVEPFVVACC